MTFSIQEISWASDHLQLNKVEATTQTEKRADRIVFWMRWIFTILISGLITFFLINHDTVPLFSYPTLSLFAIVLLIIRFGLAVSFPKNTYLENKFLKKYFHEYINQPMNLFINKFVASDFGKYVATKPPGIIKDPEALQKLYNEKRRLDDSIVEVKKRQEEALRKELVPLTNQLFQVITNIKATESLP